MSRWYSSCHDVRKHEDEARKDARYGSHQHQPDRWDDPACRLVYDEEYRRQERLQEQREEEAAAEARREQAQAEARRLAAQEEERRYEEEQEQERLAQEQRAHDHDPIT